MSEIKWTFTVKQDNTIIVCGVLSTIDFSFPAKELEAIGKRYAPCTIKVRDGHGQIWEKDW